MKSLDTWLLTELALARGGDAAEAAALRDGHLAADPPSVLDLMQLGVALDRVRQRRQNYLEQQGVNSGSFKYLIEHKYLGEVLNRMSRPGFQRRHHQPVMVPEILTEIWIPWNAAQPVTFMSRGLRFLREPEGAHHWPHPIPTIVCAYGVYSPSMLGVQPKWKAWQEADTWAGEYLIQEEPHPEYDTIWEIPQHIAFRPTLDAAFDELMSREYEGFKGLYRHNFVRLDRDAFKKALEDDLNSPRAEEPTPDPPPPYTPAGPDADLGVRIDWDGQRTLYIPPNLDHSVTVNLPDRDASEGHQSRLARFQNRLFDLTARRERIREVMEPIPRDGDPKEDP